MIDDLTLLHGQVTPRCTARVSKVFEYHTIQLMTRGQVELFVDQQRTEMRGPWFWPCYPGPAFRFHPYRSGASWEHRYVAFTGPRVRRWEAAGLLLRQPRPLSTEEVGWLVPCYDALLQQMSRPGRWGQLRAVNLLDSLLLYLAERSRTHRPDPPPWLDQVTSQLERLDRKPDYRQLAAQHHVSLTTLRRQFRDAAGTSLHQYRLDFLATEARRRLGTTNQTIKQIADDLGYLDVYYFTRQFTQAVGVSPARFRRTRQA